MKMNEKLIPFAVALAESSVERNDAMVSARALESRSDSATYAAGLDAVKKYRRAKKNYRELRTAYRKARSEVQKGCNPTPNELVDEYLKSRQIEL